MKEHSSPFASSLLVFFTSETSSVCHCVNLVPGSSSGAHPIRGPKAPEVSLKVCMGRYEFESEGQAGSLSSRQGAGVTWVAATEFGDVRSSCIETTGRYCIVHSGVLPRKMLMVGSSVMMNPPNHYDHVHAFNHVGAACWMQLQITSRSLWGASRSVIVRSSRSREPKMSDVCCAHAS